jgi:hypothetical protein
MSEEKKRGIMTFEELLNSTIDKEIQNEIKLAKEAVERSWGVDDGREWTYHKVHTKDYITYNLCAFGNGRGFVVEELGKVVGVDNFGKVVFQGDYK